MIFAKSFREKSGRETESKFMHTDTRPLCGKEMATFMYKDEPCKNGNEKNNVHGI